MTGSKDINILIDNMNDREVLILEFQHVNKTLENQPNFFNRVIILILSGIGIGFAMFFKDLHDVSAMTNLAKVSEIAKSDFELLLYGGYFLTCATIISVVIDYLDWKKIIKRKELVLDKINNLKYESIEYKLGLLTCI